MKKWILLFSLLSCIAINAQQNKVTGIVTLFNSKTNTGKRVFIDRARIDDKFQKAQTAYSDANGQFELDFVEEKTGKTVYLKVAKDKLEPVNKENLSAVAGQLEVIKISMAPPDSIEKYILEIFNIGKTKAEKSLETKAAKLEAQLKMLTSSRADDAARIKALQKEKAALEEQRKNVDDQAQQLAVKYGAVDLDDASPVFRDAFLLFQQGKLDTALAMLSQLNLSNTVTRILDERDSIAAAKNELDKRDSIEKQRTIDAGQALQFKADLHRTFYQLDSAGNCYELMIRLDSLNVSYLAAYAGFLEWSNQNESAIFYYLKAVDIQRKQQRIDDPLIARIENNLGNLYMAIKKYDIAKTALQESYQIRENLSDSDVVYLSDFTKTINNLGSLYYNEKKFDSAVILYNKALSIRLQLHTKDSIFNKNEIAGIKNNLGIVYYSQKNYPLAVTNFSEALAIREALPAKDSASNQPAKAAVLNNLGNAYFMNGDNKMARYFYTAAVNITIKLSEKSLQTYAPLLAQALNSLASLYATEGNTKEAEQLFMQSLSLRTALAELDPQSYEPAVAKTAYNLGKLYQLTRSNKEAKAVYETALAIYKKLAAESPQLYNPFVKNVQQLLLELK